MALIRTNALAALVTAAVAGGALPSHAQPAENPAKEGGDLASQVVYPTAPLTTIALQYRAITGFHRVDGDQSEVAFKLSKPFRLWATNNILKISVPYITSSDVTSTGLFDSQITDLVVLPQDWGNLAVGVVTNLGVARGDEDGNFSLGPAVGAVLKSGKWTYGAFNQNLFGGETSLSQLQPILAYTFGPQFSVSLGDLQVVYDWNKSQVAQLPFGLQFNYITAVSGQPVRLYFNPQYNFRDVAGAPDTVLTFGFALITR